MKMPFGKHAGKELTQIPRGYLKWLKSQGKLYGWLAEAVDRVLAGQSLEEPDYEALVHEIIKPWDDTTTLTS